MWGTMVTARDTRAYAILDNCVDARKVIAICLVFFQYWASLRKIDHALIHHGFRGCMPLSVPFWVGIWWSSQVVDRIEVGEIARRRLELSTRTFLVTADSLRFWWKPVCAHVNVCKLLSHMDITFTRTNCCFFENIRLCFKRHNRIEKRGKRFVRDVSFRRGTVRESLFSRACDCSF